MIRLLVFSLLACFVLPVARVRADSAGEPAAGLPAADAVAAPDLPVVFSADFAMDAMGWTTREGSVWQHAAGERGEGIFRLTKSGPMGAFRAPTAWAVRGDQKLAGSFVLTARARCHTAVTVPGRDILLVIGWTGPLAYHYIHFSAENSATHNVIMRVEPDGRTMLPHAARPVPRLTKAEWQSVRVWYDRPSGLLRCYVDDMGVPVMVARVPGLPAGAIGIGSFDDLVDVDSVTLQAENR